MMNWRIEVRRTGRTWGVFGVILQPDGSGNVHGQADLLEGGFFNRAAAERSRDDWERECLQNEVEAAERHAGWDPNP